MFQGRLCIVIVRYFQRFLVPKEYVATFMRVSDNFHSSFRYVLLGHSRKKKIMTRSDDIIILERLSSLSS